MFLTYTNFFFGGGGVNKMNDPFRWFMHISFFFHFILSHLKIVYDFHR